ncbi:hypothetical protein [Halococcus sp. IIIV-5B]|uniref:hypothetical protein n=1 Tax=Halococcus sp. IIIV-5B TaxID=2321230 RepID=UPI001314FC96|nr:hypothetical protein [Halococcus sp. IIIV-5B]
MENGFRGDRADAEAVPDGAVAVAVGAVGARSWSCARETSTDRGHCARDERNERSE